MPDDTTTQGPQLAAKSPQHRSRFQTAWWCYRSFCASQCATLDLPILPQRGLLAALVHAHHIAKGTPLSKLHGSLFRCHHVHHHHAFHGCVRQLSAHCWRMSSQRPTATGRRLLATSMCSFAQVCIVRICLTSKPSTIAIATALGWSQTAVVSLEHGQPLQKSPWAPCTNQYSLSTADRLHASCAPDGRTVFPSTSCHSRQMGRYWARRSSPVFTAPPAECL